MIEPESVSLLSEKMAEVSSIPESELIKIGRKAQEYGIAHFSKEVNLNRLTNIVLNTIDYK